MSNSSSTCNAESTMDRRMAYTLLRTTIGINFLGHGAVRLLHGNALFAQGMVKQLTGTPLPAAFVYCFGWLLPFLEFGIGVLLVTGLLTRSALIAGSWLMISLMVGVTLNQDWTTAGGQLLYALILAILLFLRVEYDSSWLALLGRRLPG